MMEKLGITPGPWKTEKCSTYCGSPRCGLFWPGPGSFTQGTGYSEDDARAIATVPEMLEAMIKIGLYLELIDHNIGYQHSNLINTLEKATGKTWEEIKGAL